MYGNHFVPGDLSQLSEVDCTSLINSRLPKFLANHFTSFKDYSIARNYFKMSSGDLVQLWKILISDLVDFFSLQPGNLIKSIHCHLAVAPMDWRVNCLRTVHWSDIIEKNSCRIS